MSGKWCKIRPKMLPNLAEKFGRKLLQNSAEKSSAGKNCCKIQMRSISAMNSQSSMHQPGKIVAKFGRKIVAKNGREKFGREKFGREKFGREKFGRVKFGRVKFGRKCYYVWSGKRLENLNLWSVKKHQQKLQPCGMPRRNVNRDHVFCRSDVDGVLSLNLLKHAKLQPLVGMPRQSGPRCAPGKQNSNLSVDWDHVVWSIGVLSL